MSRYPREIFNNVSSRNGFLAPDKKVLYFYDWNYIRISPIPFYGPYQGYRGR